MNGKIYQFDDYLLDLTEQRLQKNGESISLPPKVFEVLAVLVREHGKLITYEELMEEVWKDTFVEETNLRYSIHSIRKAFNEDYIETVPKHGYRFNAEVSSFTPEEFIEKHTGKIGEDENESTSSGDSGVSDSATDADPGGFLSSPVRILAVAVLAAGLGFAGFYFWSSDSSAQSENDEITVSVIPFSVIGAPSDSADEIQKGLANSLVFNLGKIKGLNVSRSETKQVDDKLGDAISLARDSGSDFVLTGSYRIEDERVIRVNSKLHRVADGKTLVVASETLKDRNRIETEKIISLRLSRKIYQLFATFADEEFLKTQGVNEEVVKNFVVGQQILRTYDRNRRDEGVGSFEKITQIKPNWAKGYAKYAEALALTHGQMPDWKKIKVVADKALAIDKNVPEAHLARSSYYQSEFDWKNAEESLKKAIELNPDYSSNYNEYGLFLDTQRRFFEAEVMFNKAIELKPFDPFYLASRCLHYYYDLKLDAAINDCKAAEDIEPGFNLTPKYLFFIYVQLEDYKKVFELDHAPMTKDELERDPIAKTLLEGKFEQYWRLRAEQRLKSEHRRKSPFAIAAFYARIPDREKTLQYLEQTAKESPNDLLYTNPDPIFDFVRNEPRFIALMTKFDLDKNAARERE